MRRLGFWVIFFFLLSGTAAAKDNLIVYTGNSFSSLYPCRHCPASIGGGIARRAKLIKTLRSRSNVLLLDSGNIFPLAKYSSLNAQRAGVMLKALSMLKYDAVGIGSRDLVFSPDMFKQAVKKYRIPFVACNFKFSGVKPYIIKRIGNIKVGITAVAPQIKNGIAKVKDGIPCLARVIKILKRKADYLIVLSGAKEDFNNRIIKTLPQINLLAAGGISHRKTDKQKIGSNQLVVYPAFRARSVGIVSLKREKHRVVGVFAGEKKLSLDRVEDKSIKSILPSCFADNDCPQKPGLDRKCKSPGINSRCIYIKPVKFDVHILTDQKCRQCSVKPAEAVVKSLFKGADFQILDYRRKQAQEILKKNNILTLPAVILDKKVEKDRNFPKYRKLLEAEEGSYILKPEYAGVFMYLNRKPLRNKIDIFLDIYAPGAKAIAKQMRETFKTNKGWNVDVYFVMPIGKNGGMAELSPSIEEEYQRLFVIEKLYPQKFWDYLLNRLDNIKSSWWQKPMENLGINVDRVYRAVEGKEYSREFKKNLSFIKELYLFRPAILINNRRIFALSVNAGKGYALSGILDLENDEDK